MNKAFFVYLLVFGVITWVADPTRSMFISFVLSSCMSVTIVIVTKLQEINDVAVSKNLERLKSAASQLESAGKKTDLALSRTKSASSTSEAP